MSLCIKITMRSMMSGCVLHSFYQFFRDLCAKDADFSNFFRFFAFLMILLTKKLEQKEDWELED